MTFLRETENLDFMQAVERLARDAGMTMPERDPASAAKAAIATGLTEVMEAAVRFYRAQLTGAQAADARAYLDRRGVTAETRERFELGFAGGARRALFAHLTGKGVAPAQLIEAGLARRPDDGGQPYDLFRDRILFPIRDARGRAIAFGGRAMAAEARAKYLNSPETPLFDKGRTLFNLGPARTAAGKTGALVVVEGYMDVIALAQAGLAHAVAPLGTAITAEQVQLMWRIAPEPVVALDGDAAGQGAAQRLVDLALPLLTAGKGLRFALMPAKQDPDDVIRASGLRAFEALITASRPMIDLLWERETAGGSFDSPERRAALDARLRGHLARIADPAIRTHYQSEFRLRSAALFNPARPRPARGKSGGGKRDGRFREPPAPSRPTTRASLLATAEAGPAAEGRVRESAILAGCLNHPALAHRFEARLERASFLCPDLAAVRDALVSALDDDAPGLADRVAARLGRDARAELIAVVPAPADRDLRAGADIDLAARAIGEALERLIVGAGRIGETRDAERDIEGEADEGVTWRLREAADAAHAAVARPLSEGQAESQDESSLSQTLQNLIDAQIWKKPPKR